MSSLQQKYLSFISTNILHHSDTTPMLHYQIPWNDISQMISFVIVFDFILLNTLNHVTLPLVNLFELHWDQIQSQINLKVSDGFDYDQMAYPIKIVAQKPQKYVRSISIDLPTNHSQVNLNDRHQHIQRVEIKFEVEKQFSKSVKSNLAFFMVNKHTKETDKGAIHGKFSIENIHIEVQKQRHLTIQNIYHQQIEGGDKPISETQDRHRNDFDFHDPLLVAVQMQNFNDDISYPILYETQNQQNALQSIRTKQYFEKLLSETPPYSANNIPHKSGHLFISHDMKNGYVEQIMFSNPQTITTSQSKYPSPDYQTFYRFQHLPFSSIFNYFSHQTISIPPKHWRLLCLRYKVKCLGTFIVEPQKIHQNNYLNEAFALQLVYLAKRSQFDGYLLNIQDTVNDMNALKHWLQFLRQQIHKHIPNSIIVWYDSLTDNSPPSSNQPAFINYQNEVNSQNEIFYNLTDHFFTNYWWTDKQLRDDIKQFRDEKIIYVGNDVWGRGTFGGGEYNIYKAIDKIEQMNRQVIGSSGSSEPENDQDYGQTDISTSMSTFLSNSDKTQQSGFGAALFAPGYTYENGGENNNPTMKMNEDKLYRGVINKPYNLTNNRQQLWEPINRQLQKDLLTQEQEQKDTWTGKHFAISIGEYKSRDALLVKFVYQFKANEQPGGESQQKKAEIVQDDGDIQTENQEDNAQNNGNNIGEVSYKIKLRVIDRLTGQQSLSSTLARQKFTPISKIFYQTHLYIPQPNILTPQSLLQVIFLSSINLNNQFQQQTIYVSYYEPQKDWLKQVPLTLLHFEQDYNTYFNKGYGQTFYFHGQKTYQNGYNYMSDYDIPMTHDINHPLLTDIQHEDSFIGGSCLNLLKANTEVILLKLQSPKIRKMFPKFYQIKIVYKGNQGDLKELFFVKGKDEGDGGNEQKYGEEPQKFVLEKVVEHSGVIGENWIEEVYELSSDNLKSMKSLFKHRDTIELVVKFSQPVALGNLYLNPDPEQPQKVMNSQNFVRSPRLTLSVSQTFKSPQTPHSIYLTLSLKNTHIEWDDSNIERYLIKISTEQTVLFAGFIYVSQENNLSPPGDIQTDRRILKGELSQVVISSSNIIQESVNIQVLQVDNFFKEKTMIDMEGVDLAALKRSDLGHEIVLKNY